MNIPCNLLLTLIATLPPPVFLHRQSPALEECLNSTEHSYQQQVILYCWHYFFYLLVFGFISHLFYIRQVHFLSAWKEEEIRKYLPKKQNTKRKGLKWIHGRFDWLAKQWGEDKNPLKHLLTLNHPANKAHETVRNTHIRLPKVKRAKGYFLFFKWTDEVKFWFSFQFSKQFTLSQTLSWETHFTSFFVLLQVLLTAYNNAFITV